MQRANTAIHDRGHTAEKPGQIPLRGWKDIALRLKDKLIKDHVLLLSAGIAFYLFLSVYPAIAAALSIYGLVMETVQVKEQMGQLAPILPEKAFQMVSNILEQQSQKSASSLSWSLVLGLVISLWSANKGAKAIFEGVNITYDELDKRSFLKFTGITLLFTVGGIMVGFIAIAMIVGFPALVDRIGLPPVLATVIQFLRWFILALVIMFSLSVVYKVAPCRCSPQFKWTSWGAMLATLIWLGGSLLFSLYVRNFNSFSQTYGTFAAVIILMLWFLLSAFVILLGSEINAEMEYQTSHDTTIGEAKPMGQRGGYHADHSALREQ